MKVDTAALKTILPRWRGLLLFWAILFVVALVTMSWGNPSAENLLEFVVLAFLQLTGFVGGILFIFRQRKRPAMEHHP